jgi:hypothetical protein
MSCWCHPRQCAHCGEKTLHKVYGEPVCEHGCTSLTQTEQRFRAAMRAAEAAA